METIKLTEKTAKVLEILKGASAPMFAADIAVVAPELFEKAEKSVSPLLTNLGKNGWAVNVGKGPRQVPDKDGKEVTREYAMYEATDAGRALVYEVK